MGLFPVSARLKGCANLMACDSGLDKRPAMRGNYPGKNSVASDFREPPVRTLFFNSSLKRQLLIVQTCKSQDEKGLTKSEAYFLCIWRVIWKNFTPSILRR